MRYWKLLAGTATVLLVMAALGGCATRGTREDNRIRIGLLPIVDSLPFLVAEERGYFTAEGLEVKLTVFNSALERDNALQAGEIDGAVGDPLAVATMVQSGLPVKILSVSLGATPQEGRFAILTPPGSELNSLEKLKNVEIAISPNTIIEYVVDEILTRGGFKPEEIKKQPITQIPVRFQMLMEGKVKAAALPDPMATLAVVQGARLVADDTAENLSQTVILFREPAFKDRENTLRRMFLAYAKAVEKINANPEDYRSLLEEKARLPRGLSQYRIDRFPLPQPPRRQDLERVVSWMVKKGMLKQPLSYEQLVDDRFVR